MHVSGIQFVTDEKGRRRGVLLDLKQHGDLWEDIYDLLVAQERENEPRESLQSVRRRLRRLGKLRG